MTTQDNTAQGGNLQVVVHNEDDGTTETLNAGPGTPVSTMIERMYKEFGLEPGAGDRLRFDDGEDVKQYADLKLRDLIDQGLSLEWRFAGDQGGAERA